MHTAGGVPVLLPTSLLNICSDRVLQLAPGLRATIDMANRSRNRKNQPPTGQGKHQSRYLGEPRKLEKRSDVLQAQRGHPELNLGDADEEAAHREGDQRNPKRPKAGR
jgi:hypothetical protein